MTNKRLNNDLKLNFARIVMDRGRIYSFIKKITPMYWYTRATTRYLMKNYQKKDLICAEIGVDYGLNAKTLLKLLPIKKLYLIDPYQQELDSVPGEERYKNAKKLLRKYKDKTEFIRKSSSEAIKDIPKNIDFIYLDGSHEYEQVKKDIELYYPKVKKGGIIGGHDFWASTRGVCKAVIEFAEENNLDLYGEITDWWIIKK